MIIHAKNATMPLRVSIPYLTEINHARNLALVAERNLSKKLGQVVLRD
jgi:hypothetical protein